MNYYSIFIIKFKLVYAPFSIFLQYLINLIKDSKLITYFIIFKIVINYFFILITFKF